MLVYFSQNYECLCSTFFQDSITVNANMGRKLMGNDVFPCEPIIHLQVLKGIRLLFFLTFGWNE